MFTSVFLLNIVYFSVCLTSNKLYLIEDQLADVSTRFYTSASLRRRVGPSASWTVGELDRRRVDRNSFKVTYKHVAVLLIFKTYVSKIK